MWVFPVLVVKSARINAFNGKAMGTISTSQLFEDPKYVRLLAALTLGHLPQYEGFARASGFVSACRALISLLEDQPTEETKSITYQKDLSQIRPTEAESVETRIIILFSSVVALKRSLFDTGSNPTSEFVVKPFAEREVISFGLIAHLGSQCLSWKY